MSLSKVSSLFGVSDSQQVSSIGTPIKPKQRFVFNRNGIKEPIKLDKISERLEKIAKILEIEIDAPFVTQQVAKDIVSDQSTQEIDELVAKTCADLVYIDLNYPKLGSFIVSDNIIRYTPSTFLECLNLLKDNQYKFHNEIINRSLISDKVYNFAIENIDLIHKKIKEFEIQDMNFDYFGIRTLRDGKYLQRSNGKILERATYMFMRVALGIFSPVYNKKIITRNVECKDPKCNIRDQCQYYHSEEDKESKVEVDDLKSVMIPGDINKAMNIFEKLILKKLIFGSPVLFNCGTNFNFTASCLLISIPDDLKKIYECFGKIAGFSKCGGGLGINISEIRAFGSLITSTGSEAAGIIPVCRQLENIMNNVTQGKRTGSFAVTLNIWHAEVEAFIDLVAPSGEDSRRARSLFITLYSYNIFFERIYQMIQEEKKPAAERKIIYWSLFCPNQVKDLLELSGDEFTKRYEYYEEKKLYSKQVDIKKLMNQIGNSCRDTGKPFVCNSDQFNLKSNQANLGRIYCSNLCVEIGSRTGKGKDGFEAISVCNLASICLKSFIKEITPLTNRDYLRSLPSSAKVLYEGKQLYFDLHELGLATAAAQEGCDRLISNASYSEELSKRCNLNDRPTGVGISALADVFQIMGYSWGSEKAKSLDNQISKTMDYYSLNKSCDLGQELGGYKGWEESPLVKDGLFNWGQWEKYKHPRCPLSYKPTNEDFIKPEAWVLLREKTKLGVRNSLRIAHMPTQSTSQILEASECFEPKTSNRYLRRTIAGNFPCINEYLVKLLQSRGLWTDKVFQQIKNDNGSVKNIIGLDEETKLIYKTAYEIDPKILIIHASIRGAGVCHSSSINFTLPKISPSKMASIYIDAYFYGLKTDCYYARSMPAVLANNISDEVLLPVEIKQKVSSEATPGEIEVKEPNLNIYGSSLNKLSKVEIQELSETAYLGLSDADIKLMNKRKKREQEYLDKYPQGCSDGMCSL